MRAVFRAVVWLMIVLANLHGMAPPRTAWAQDPLTVLAAPPPEYEFGKTMTFEVSARSSGADIIGATVFVRAPDIARTFVGEARLAPGLEITATYTLNLNQRPLPPFAPVEYWWEVRDSAGGSLTTEPQSFTYADNRFNWQVISNGIVTIHWHQGDRAFGQQALDVAATAFVEANRDLQAQLQAPLDFYIYADTQAAQAALAPVGRIWADGYADPALGLAVVAVADDVDAGVNLERELPHELTHLLVYRVTGDRYTQVPTWLNEGLAVMNQVQPDPGFPAALDAARQAGTLLSLSSLCGPLPADPAQAQLFYAESESVVRYIRETYGSSSLTSLLAAYADGLGCAAGVKRALGLSLDELERDWLAETFHIGPINPRPGESAPVPWAIFAALVLLSPIMFFLLIRRKPSRDLTGL